MNVQRKLQMAAVAVCANGLVALLGASPELAHAASCSDSDFIGCIGFESCPANMTSYCQAYAPSGCSVSAANCFEDEPPGIWCGPWPGNVVLCRYQ